MKRFIIKDEILQFNFMVQYDGDIDKGIKHFTELLHEEYDSLKKHRMTRGMFFRVYPYKDGFIWLHKDATPATVAHECMHAMNYIRDILELPLNDDTEEVFAYYMEWMIRTISRRLGWHVSTKRHLGTSKRAKRKSIRSGKNKRVKKSHKK